MTMGEDLGEACYQRAAWRPPADEAQRRVLERWLAGLLLAIGLCVAMALFLNSSFGPQEMTGRMERMIKQLDTLREIPPETAQVIERVIRQPGYDCNQVSCDVQLKSRNSAVRAQLFSLLEKRLTSEPTIAKSPKPPIDEITSSAR
jgi:hypothetical protein